MELCRYLCDSGGKILFNREINEDKVFIFSVSKNGVIHKYYIMLDGASGLGINYQIKENYTAAEWYVSHFCELFEEFVKDEINLVDIKDIIRRIIVEMDNSISLFEKNNSVVMKTYEKPSASLGIIHSYNDNIDVYLLGDIDVAIVHNEKVTKLNNPYQQIIHNNDLGVLDKMNLLSKENGCNVIETVKNDLIRKELYKNRSKMNKNCDGGYYICSTSVEAVQHITVYNFLKKDLETIIMFSDGLNYNILDIDLDSLYDLIKKDNISNIVKTIRRKEDDDCFCNKYLRFKKHDDLSILILDF